LKFCPSLSSQLFNARSAEPPVPCLAASPPSRWRALGIAAVAIGAGKPFVDTVAAQGIPILLAGAAVLLTNVLVVMLGGMYVLKIPYDSLIGVMAGATGNPAIPAYGARMLQSDRVDVGYATIFPSMTIVKVIVAQVAVTLLSAPPPG